MAYTFKHGDRPLEGLTVQRAVGRGGFGEVYYALTDSGKQVALKFLRENPEIELRGISHVMNLKSPYLITIYDVKRNAAGDPFVIMEYVSGPSLRELMLAAAGEMGVQKAAFFLGGIAKGLSYLHERGIVHRDLKPANIFYDDGYVKIGDYGLSKHISVSRHSGQTVSVGTVHYMAPEIGSGNYTKAIDIYALGVILYEMLTGRLPFSGASTAEILMRHLRDNPDLSGIPTPFAGVIAKALAKDPNDRYQSVDEMVAAVLESADVSRSMESFDHSALTQVPRSIEASDVDDTVTSPRRVPAPPLDVRELRVPDLAAGQQALPARLQRKLDHLTHKLEQKAARLERKFGVRQGVTPPTAPKVHRRGQVFILLAVTAVIAVALGLLTMDRGPEESRVVAVGLFLIGGTFGPLLAHLRFLQRSPTRNTLLDRLAYASLGALFMLPGFGLAGGEVSDDLARIILSPMAVMLLCDWGQRIEAGRRGKVDGRAAFWPAIIGLVTAHIVQAGDYAWTAAGICAAISLLTQAAAALWPHPYPTGWPGAALRVPPGSPVVPDAAALGEPGSPSVTTLGALPPQRLGDLGPPGNASPASPARALAPVPRSTAVRAVFGVITTCALAATLGSFFSLVAGRPSDPDVRAGLLFATLTGVAWMPFLLAKSLQRHKSGLWRGTLRMLVVSLSLTLTAGMITNLAYVLTDRDEVSAAIFGLVAGVVIALVALCVPGRRTATPQRTPPRVDAPPEPAAVVVSAAQPSFAGRTASAGASFLGKVLLLAGLVLAVGQTPLLDYARGAIGRGDLQVDRETSRLIEAGWPHGVALIPLGLGSLLLVVARRRDGATHFFRGCVGCALVLWSALVAILWGGPPLRMLFTTGELTTLDRPNLWGPVLLTGLSLAVGVFLLLWPKDEANKPIIV